MGAKMKKKPAAPKRRAFRLLPMTVTMLSLLFIIKVNEVYLGSERLRDVYGVRDASASEKKEEKKEEPKKDEKKESGHGEEKKDDAKKEEGAHGEEKKDDKKADGKKEEGGHGEEKKEDSGHGEKKDDGHGGGSKPVEEERTHGTGKHTVKEIEALKAKESQPRFSKTELDLLQNLTKRREELETRDRELDLKAKVLEATDKRINDKIIEMKTLQAELTKILAQYNEKQDLQIKSLVKIYENMKPDEAAKIFNELDMPILLEVIGKMSERKVALVLANMDPKRARDVTQELAERRKKTTASNLAPTPTAPAAGQ